MDDYNRLEKIGEGTYGEVYKAQHITSGKIVALKKTRLEVRPTDLLLLKRRGFITSRKLICKVSISNAVDSYRHEDARNHFRETT